MGIAIDAYNGLNDVLIKDTPSQAQSSKASTGQRVFACQAIPLKYPVALKYPDPDAGDGTSAHNRNGAGDESEDDKDNDDDDWSDSSNLEENVPFDSEE